MNYNKDEQIFRKILTSLNGQPFNGLMQTLVYEVMGYGSSIQTNQVWTILGDATLARFNCLDYTQMVNSRISLSSLTNPTDCKYYRLFKATAILY